MELLAIVEAERQADELIAAALKRREEQIAQAYLEEIDGFVSYAGGPNDGAIIGGALLVDELRWSNMMWGGGGPGYGLAQWEGPRQRDFAAWAGHDIRGSSFAEQLRFVQYELTHSEAAAGRALRGATDARSAAEIVTRLYERPADTAGEAARRGDRAAAMAR